MLWYVSQDRKSEGPYSEQRVAMLISWGKISFRAYVCDEHASNWVPIARTAFAPLFEQSVRASSVTETTNPQRNAGLRGGRLRFSRRALQRLSALIAGAAMCASVLTLAVGPSTKSHGANASTALPIPRQARYFRAPTAGPLDPGVTTASHHG